MKRGQKGIVRKSDAAKLAKAISKNSWLKFANGRFVEEERPDWYVRVQDENDSFSACGFYLSKQFGDSDGVGFNLWVKSQSTPGENYDQWIVDFSDGARFEPIYVDSVIDLIELLAKLSPIVIAAGFQHDVYGMPYLKTSEMPEAE